MRWCAVIIAVGLLAPAFTDPGPNPEPKKFKPDSKDKYSKITEEEKIFLRDIESKYGVKSDKTEERDDKKKLIVDTKPQPFPAVIAIEIVNDTDSDGKSKRTVDANIGYGYRTNTGYTYSYFGKPNQDHGKFMIYPYSQDDIPSRPSQQTQRLQYDSQSTKISKYTSSPKSPNVEIQPSRAYELVPVTEQSTYNSHEPVSEIKTQYEKVQTLQAPPPPQETLYTMYNGDQLSGLSRQFPAIMSNYLVDSSQLLQNPLFQSVGLTPDHLRQHSPIVDQRVVPVLVLRIPSSHLRNPAADLYPNLPSNYPLSNYLNNVNLQDLVTQYFRKIGYSNIPQVMTHLTSLANSAQQYSEPDPQYTSRDILQYSPQAAPQNTPQSAPQYTPQSAPQYSAPDYSAPIAPQNSAQTAPRYSASNFQQYNSGIYSQYTSDATAARPYPDTSDITSQYSAPSVHQYSAPTASVSISQYPTAHSANNKYETQQYAAPEPTPTYTQSDYSGVQYSAVQPVIMKYPVAGQQFMARDPQTGQPTLYEYVDPNSEKYRQYIAQNQGPQYNQPQYDFEYVEGPSAAPPQYQKVAEATKQAESSSKSLYTYGSSSEDTAEQTAVSPTGQYENARTVSDTPVYSTPQPETDDKHLSISENYPSKDHTRVTVVPPHKSSNKRVQSVSYVTPSPLSAKYHPYKIMAPQAVLGDQTQQQVAYINSHSIPAHVQQAGYSFSDLKQAGHQSFLPPISKSPSFLPRYHAHSVFAQHSKRMLPKAENKPRSVTPLTKKPERTEKRPTTSL